MLAPGFKDTSDHFMAMLKSLDNPEGREKYGFLGISSYMGAQGQTSNEVMTVSYWRNTEGVHAFAESPVHREGWDWWNRTVKQHPHMVIFHEIYKAERKAYENIYVNSQPTLIGMSLFLSLFGCGPLLMERVIGGTSFPVKSDEKEEQQWVNPLVEANRGVLATSNGRLGLRGSHQ
jgi:heme-degrading monooxygenase HmoA